MDLDPSADQNLLLSAIEPLLNQYRQLPQPAGPDYVVLGDALDAALEEAGFYGDPEGSGLDAPDAALVLEQIAQCPYALPAMASLIVSPGLGTVFPRPIALMNAPDAPTRFLGESKTALVIDDHQVWALDLAGEKIEPLKTIFAYPYARLTSYDRGRARVLDGVTPERLRDLWRLGLTFEILGALRAAHALTVDYVKQREQFKRPIGSFQAVQHRLGEGATHLQALSYLGARAAWSGEPADIALAASYAQKQAGQIIYDCHQFHGAMGLTLEYVLHHWTYRVKVLTGELGGSSAQGRRAAQAIWGETA